MCTKNTKFPLKIPHLLSPINSIEASCAIDEFQESFLPKIYAGFSQLKVNSTVRRGYFLS